MKDKTDKMIDKATIVLGVLLAIMIGLTIYDAVVNAPENVPIIVKQTSSTITTEYFTRVSDVLYVFDNNCYEIYKK